MSKRSKSSGDKTCCFCGSTEDNELVYGKFYEHDGIVTHYYCMLLSSNMEQRGNDDEGILGFLTEDIRKELRRGKRLFCSHCKKNGATLGCCNIKCKKIFHFPCGLKAGSLHQFFGEFRSYCINHRPKQKIDEHVKKAISQLNHITCYICYDKADPHDFVHTLWAPCCKKDAWFHRTCVQQLAMSAGYFFKCPLCNNKKEFQKAMLDYGIFIPSQDASWELVPNAFQELLYRHDQCDAGVCVCPKGRKYTSTNAKWELVLCRTCGSQGIHMECGQLKWANPFWECIECTAILSKVKKSESSGTTINITRREKSDTSKDKDIWSDSDNSDTDISVGSESPPSVKFPLPLPERRLRPGPRSFKLQQESNIRDEELKKKVESTFVKSDLETSESFSCFTKTVQTDKDAKFSLEKVLKSSLDNEMKDVSVSLVVSENNSTKEDVVIDNENDIEIIDEKIKTSSAVNYKDDLHYRVQLKENTNIANLELKKDNEENKCLDTDSDPIMNIKIVNVTSLPLDVFDNALDPVTIDEKIKNALTANQTVNSNIQNPLAITVATADDNKVVEAAEKKRKSDSSSVEKCVSDYVHTLEEKSKKVRVSESNEDIECLSSTATWNIEGFKSKRLTRSLETPVLSVISSNTINQTDSSSTVVMHETHCSKTKKKTKNNIFNEMPTTMPMFAHSNQNKEAAHNSRANCTSVLPPNGNYVVLNTFPTLQCGNKMYVCTSQQNVVQENGFINTSVPPKQVLCTSTIASDTISRRSSSVQPSSSSNYLATNRRSSSVQPSSSNNYHTTSVPNTSGFQKTNTGLQIRKKRIAATRNISTKSEDSQSLNTNCDAGFSPGVQQSTTNIAICVSSGTRGGKPMEAADAYACSESSSSESKDSSEDVDTAAACSSHFVAQTDFAEVTSNPNTCNRPRLMPETMSLQDLKFRVLGPNYLQMILYDTFSVFLKADSSNRSNTNLAIRETTESNPFVGMQCQTSDVVSHGNIKSNLGYVNVFASDFLNIHSATGVRSCDDGLTDNDKCEDAKENLNPVTISYDARNDRFATSVFDGKDKAVSRENSSEESATETFNCGGLTRTISSAIDKTELVSSAYSTRLSKRKPNASNERKNVPYRTEGDLNLSAVVQTQKVLEDTLGVCTYRNSDNCDSGVLETTKESSFHSSSLSKAVIGCDKYFSSIVKSTDLANENIDRISNNVLQKYNYKDVDIKAHSDSTMLSRRFLRDSTRGKCENQFGTCRVSIDLERIQELIDAKPSLFYKQKCSGNDRNYAITVDRSIGTTSDSHICQISKRMDAKKKKIQGVFCTPDAILESEQEHQKWRKRRCFEKQRFSER